MTGNEIGKITLDSAFDVHQELGSGLFESIYEESMMNEPLRLDAFAG